MPRIRQAPGRVEFNYIPRPQFLPYHQRNERWSCVVAHRRAGKTVACVNDLVVRGLRGQKKHPQYGYVAPFRQQAKNIAWLYLKEATKGFATEVRESDLSVRLPNDALVSLYGADNPDALRGMYFDGVVVDEFGDCRPSLWQEVLLPALADRKGWASFIGTPKGKNQFYDTYELSKKDQKWLSMMLRADQTHIIDPEELDAMRAQMTEAQFEREMLCNFHASIEGTYYTEIVNRIEASGQITDAIAYDPKYRVNAVMDLGFSDSTAIWFWQEKPQGVHVLRCYASNGKPLVHYMDYMDELPYAYDTIYLPHDAAAKTLQTGRSTAEQFIDRFRDKARLDKVPMLSVQHGIEAARLMLPDCHFNATDCKDGLDGLRMYRRKYNELTKTFDDKPLHDWACLAPDTPITTPAGTTPIADLKVGDLIRVAGQDFPVSATFTREATTQTLHFADGTCVECTPEHRFFTTRGLLTADALRYGDCVLTGEALRPWLHHPKGIKEGFTESFRDGATVISPLVAGMWHTLTGRLAASIAMYGSSVIDRYRAVRMSWRYPATPTISPRKTGFFGPVTSSSRSTRTNGSYSTAGHSTKPVTARTTTTRTKADESSRSIGRYLNTILEACRRGATSITSMATRITTTRTTCRRYLAQSIGNCTVGRPRRLRLSLPLWTEPESLPGGGTGRRKVGDGTAPVQNGRGKSAQLLQRCVNSVIRTTRRTIRLGPNTVTLTVKPLLCVSAGTLRRVHDLTIDHHHAYEAAGCAVKNSDYADGFRYLALTCRPRSNRRRNQSPIVDHTGQPFQTQTLLRHNAFKLSSSLDEMHAEREAAMTRINTTNQRV